MPCTPGGFLGCCASLTELGPSRNVGSEVALRGGLSAAWPDLSLRERSFHWGLTHVRMAGLLLVHPERGQQTRAGAEAVAVGFLVAVLTFRLVLQITL